MQPGCYLPLIYTKATHRQMAEKYDHLWTSDAFLCAKMSKRKKNPVLIESDSDDSDSGSDLDEVRYILLARIIPNFVYKMKPRSVLFSRFDFKCAWVSFSVRLAYNCCSGDWTCLCEMLDIFIKTKEQKMNPNPPKQIHTYTWKRMPSFIIQSVYKSYILSKILAFLH